MRLIPTESEEQITVFSWARLQEGKFPELKLMHHIPNGGKRGKAEAARFKAEGVKAGVPDIFLPAPRGGKHGLYVEMKAKDGRVSEEQKRFLSELKKEGYFCAVCYGADEAIETIKKYLEGVKN